MADFVIKTPIFTGSYVNLFRPRASEEGKEPKYSICMLYKKEDFEAGKLKDLEKAIIQTAQKKFGPKAEAMLKTGKIRGWFRDGDVEKPESPEYAGMVFLNASTTRKPGVVDKSLQPVMSEEDAYSGCLFRASLGLFAYDKAGNKGVGFGLRNVLVVEKGERIDGRRSAAADFAEFAEDGTAADGDDVLD